jgi:4-hydroxybenzoate polyprenyltransferase
MDESAPPSKPPAKLAPANEDAPASAPKQVRRRTPAATDAAKETTPKRRAPRAKAENALDAPDAAPAPAAPRRRSRAKAPVAEAAPEQAPISPAASAAAAEEVVTSAPHEEPAAAAPPPVASEAAPIQTHRSEPRSRVEPYAEPAAREENVPASTPPPPRESIAAPVAAAARVSAETASAPVHMASASSQRERPPAAAADPTPPMTPSFARKAAPAPPSPARAKSAPHPADTSPRSARLLDVLIERLPPQYRERTREYLVLMRMDRPVGALLLLWPTWWALWFASNDFPPLGALVIFTLGVFVMRSAGCVINDYADHGWLDAKVERTRGRPMAAGRVTKKEALTLFAGLLAFAFVLVLFTNRLTILLSFGGAALAAIYPFTKRVTHLAQVVLGAAFGWSIPMAFAAVTNSLPPLCWLLFLANVLFSTIYDTEYAMVDRDDDIRAGAKSTAILFADADRAIIGVLMATFLFAMLLAGLRVHLHWPYYVGLAGAAGLFAYQQWLIRARERTACFAAFRNNNWVGLLLWVGLVLALAIR